MNLDFYVRTEYRGKSITVKPAPNPWKIEVPPAAEYLIITPIQDELYEDDPTRQHLEFRDCDNNPLAHKELNGIALSHLVENLERILDLAR